MCKDKHYVCIHVTQMSKLWIKNVVIIRHTTVRVPSTKGTFYFLTLNYVLGFCESRRHCLVLHNHLS